MKIFIVTAVYDEDGNISSHTQPFLVRSEARTHLRALYVNTRQDGHVNDPVELPGMFAHRTDAELCDGLLDSHITPDRITVWDGQGCYFDGKVGEFEI